MEKIYVLMNPNTGEYVGVDGFAVSGRAWNETVAFAMPFASKVAAMRFVETSGCNATPVVVDRCDVVFADSML